MKKMRVNRNRMGKTSVNIPSFLRDKFDLQDGDQVEVDTDGRQILIRKVVK